MTPGFLMSIRIIPQQRSMGRLDMKAAGSELVSPVVPLTEPERMIAD
jgi:hypothetical protein